jgi:hypothetical protein
MGAQIIKEYQVNTRRNPAARKIAVFRFVRVLSPFSQLKKTHSGYAVSLNCLNESAASCFEDMADLPSTARSQINRTEGWLLSII